MYNIFIALIPLLMTHRPKYKLDYKNILYYFQNYIYLFDTT